MICPKCGNEIQENMKFCPECGEAVTDEAAAKAKKKRRRRKPTAEKLMQSGQRISDNIVLCSDGKYRWIYELSLIKNPTIFILVWKIFFFIILGITVFAMTIDAISWGFKSIEEFLEKLIPFGWVLVGMTVLVALGYLLYAAIMGWKYCVIFEMDEKGVNHKQLPAQAKKAEAIAALTALAGAAAGRPTIAGVGMTSARTEMYTEFSAVRKVKVYPRLGLIKLNCLLEHNQVYAEKEDFEFVKKFILDNVSVGS